MTEAIDRDRANNLQRRMELKVIAPLEIAGKALSPIEAMRWTTHIAPHVVRWTAVETGGITAIFGVTVALQQHAVEENREIRENERHDRCVITTEFRLHYTIKEYVPSDVEDVEDYIRLSGWLQVWPFLRAEIHTLSTRFGCPPLVLPTIWAGAMAKFEVIRVTPGSNPEESLTDDDALAD